MKRHLSATALALALLAGACAGATRATALPPQADESREFWPPREWISAIAFSIGDARISEFADYTTRVEFWDGRRQRLVAGAEQFQHEDRQYRTPWYRLQPGAEGDSLVIRVMVTHRNGVETTAEYSIGHLRDAYFIVYAGISMPSSDPLPLGLTNVRSYPLNPAAPARPGEYLAVSLSATDRNCLTCPS